MFEGHDQTVHDLLAARRLVEVTRLQSIFAEHAATGRPFASVLLERETISKANLLRAVAEYLGCTHVPELPPALPEIVRAAVPEDMAHGRGVVPLAADGAILSVAATDPFDPDLIGDLRFALGREVRLVVADPAQVRRLLAVNSGPDASAPETAPAGPAVPIMEPSLTEADIEQMAGQTPVVQLVNLILAQAVRDKASDIHFEPFEHEFKIRCRVDGVLHEMPPPSRNLALPVISRLKVLAGLNIAERRLPQDGRIHFVLDGLTMDLRMSTLPTQFGESVVLRVLDRSSRWLDLGQLGLPPPILAGLEKIIRRPAGIFVVTGPTGSGKTTTLYSCLKTLNAADAKLLTVEDPVEYGIDGVMQVPVNPLAGLTFPRALRAFLRQDPDIVMVGEIRDSDTARIAIQASLTGHLVLSTLHTNDAPGAVARLVDMGIERFLLASALEGVLAQRLVHRICPSCRTAADPSGMPLRELGLDVAARGSSPVYRGIGCASCQGTGFKGRIGIFEFLPMTEALRELVVRGASLGQLRDRAREEGMTSLREAGIKAALDGGTTVEEIVRWT